MFSNALRLSARSLPARTSTQLCRFRSLHTKMQIELPAIADCHVHLRDGDMMKVVAPTVKQGGASLAYVMPNLVPPITSVAQAQAYHQRLRDVDPFPAYLMTLYLSPEITPEVIAEAAASGIIAGVKSYPKGVTTNSDAGVYNYEQYYPVFEAMEKHDLVLNLHGESPPSDDVTVLNAEQTFLPTLIDLHKRFPKLRIVLEHCTTAAAVEAVKQCGPTVVATITAHHLYIIIDDWAGNPYCFCKPVAKTPADRRALVEAATSGNPKFFLGTDSAPHPKKNKIGERTAAGVFTQPYAAQYIATIFERVGALDKLKGFMCDYGRQFYKTVEKGWETKEDVERNRIILSKEPTEVASVFGQDEVTIVPFLAGEKLWSLQWKD